MILGPVGDCLIHPDNSLLFKKTIFTATDSVQHPDIIALGREMIAHKQGTMHVTFDDVLCHVTYMPITDTGWSIALVCHDDDVLADYNHLTNIMIILVILGILLIAWITRKVVQSNIQPLNKLLEATRIISEGNYATVIEESRHKDVIGKLQNAFRKMQLAIMASLSEILLTKYDTDEENKKLEQVLPLAEEAGKRRQIFIQNISRQFTTPLNIIEGLTSVLVSNIAARQKGKAAKKQQDKDISEICDTLKYQSNHLVRNTLMLFDTSDTGAPDSARYEKRDNVLCNELARDCIDYAQKLFSIEDIIFKTELPDDFSIKSNHLYVMRTIRELLYNAAKFSDGYITILLSQTDTTVRFLIEDVGPGLPKNAEELIFVPFTKIDDLTEGLGLGLPLCKRHITSLGGDLIYDENYQQGCRFIVELPKG
jgi:signal transduction histidine kinase